MVFFFFFFLRYDRNSNLNSHTHIFKGPRDCTHTLIEECSFLGKGFTIEPNTQVAIVTIAFKPMASTYNSCSYHQAKTPISF